MTATEMRDWFDILQDKYNSPYFTETEKDEFIMDANWDYINEYIGDYENPPIMGRDKSAVNALRSLIFTDVQTSSAGGLITETSINSALSKIVIIPLSIVPAGGKPALFLNHSDIHKAEQNVFKAGLPLQPNYTIDSTGYILYPNEVYTACKVTVLVEPDAIDSLPASQHHKIIAKAMTKTGLVTNNEAITLMEGVTNG